MEKYSCYEFEILMCKECDIPIEMKGTMIDDMNKIMGIKKI